MNWSENSEMHTFAVCAYKESPYLENCLKSLKNQTVKSSIIMTTSTPNVFIKSLAEKYGVPLWIREGKSDIRDDWNFAYNKANSKYVTIAHQDDVYHEDYVKCLLDKVSNHQNVIMYFSDYLPIKNEQIGKRDINSKIRRLLRIPMKSELLARHKFFRRAILAFGNSICCPAVTYNKGKLGDSVFTSDLKFNIDWDTFYKLAGYDGEFAYVDRPLTFYRIHDGATSKEFIQDHKRIKDDEEMFHKFWPMWLVKIIMVFYKKAYKTYG